MATQNTQYKRASAEGEKPLHLQGGIRKMEIRVSTQVGLDQIAKDAKSFVSQAINKAFEDGEKY